MSGNGQASNISDKTDRILASRVSYENITDHRCQQPLHAVDRSGDYKAVIEWKSDVHKLLALTNCLAMFRQRKTVRCSYRQQEHRECPTTAVDSNISSVPASPPNIKTPLTRRSSRMLISTPNSITGKSCSVLEVKTICAKSGPMQNQPKSGIARSSL